MKLSTSYRLPEFIAWTRRKLYVVLALAIVPVVLHQLLGQKWIALPWTVAVLLGTAASFIVGFKNAQTYGRTVDGQQVWTAIAAVSRYWGTICRDLPTSSRSTRTLIQRHLAWLTVLRYQLRDHRVWETATSAANTEYREKYYAVPEAGSPLEVELAKYLPADEVAAVTATANKGVWLLSAQSLTIRDLYAKQELALLHHTEMQKTIKEGSANDVPISAISRQVEIELGEMLGDTQLPPPLRATNEILL